MIGWQIDVEYLREISIQSLSKQQPENPSQESSEDVAGPGDKEPRGHHGPRHQQEDEQIEVDAGLHKN